MTRAAEAWRRGESGRLDFCLAANEVVGTYREGSTLALAKEIRQSEDSVQRFAKIGAVVGLVVQRWPAEGEAMRYDVPFSFWRACAELYREEGDEELVFEWLERARDEDCSLQDFRKLLPRSEVPQNFGTWLKKIRDWREYLGHIFDAMSSSKEKQAAARKAFQALRTAEDAVRELERLP